MSIGPASDAKAAIPWAIQPGLRNELIFAASTRQAATILHAMISYLECFFIV